MTARRCNKRTKGASPDGSGSTKSVPKRRESGKSGGQDGKLIDMAEAIKILKTSRPTFYRWVRTGKIKGMKVGRQWRFYREDIERFVKGEAPRIELPVGMDPLLDTLRKKLRGSGAQVPGLRDLNEVQQAVRLMIALGVAANASDIHISPHVEAKGPGTVGVLRYRIDGVLREVAAIDARLLPAIMEEWKRLSGCNTQEKEKVQESRIRIGADELGISENGDAIDVRVSFVPSVLGECLTARIIDTSAASLDIIKNAYAPHDRELLLRALKNPWGVILIAGPTGCGKTTTLYSCLNEIRRPEIKVMTVEDPVMCLLPDVVQIQVNPLAAVTFPSAVRACLKADPDVLLVGEIRELETLSLIHTTALTGHLVLSTLHTNEAAKALTRMVDIGADPLAIADATKLIMSQRLVRLVCPYCSGEESPSAEQLAIAAEAARSGGFDLSSMPHNFRKAVGCDKCTETGYRGRTVISETLEVTPEIGKALSNNASVDELRTIAIEQGMITMTANGIMRAASGETTLDEVRRVTGYPNLSVRTLSH